MMNECDVAIVGAGPGGISAAKTISRYTKRVVVLDEHSLPGGQIYKSVTQSSGKILAGLGQSYRGGKAQVADFLNSGIAHVPCSSVWHLEPDGTLLYAKDGKTHSIRAKRVIVASGAQERPFPIPGWTLPGVMAAGAAQIALKTTGAASDGAVFAGYGPLLYLIVSQYLKLGVPVRAVIVTSPPENRALAIAKWKNIPSGWRYLVTGAKLLASIKGSGVPIYSNASDLGAEGDGKLESVSFNWKNRRVKLSGVRNLFLHQGIVPNIALASAAGCIRTWHFDDQYWTVGIDDYGHTSQTAILVAGDAGGIVGADLAPVSGEIAGLTACYEIGLLDERKFSKESSSGIKKLNANRRARSFFEALYRPGKDAHIPSDENTVICRCEDIRLSQVREFLKTGGTNVNQFKSERRCGMGPCQGRMCGLTIGALVANELHGNPGAIEPQRARPPATPVSLLELASIDRSEH